MSEVGFLFHWRLMSQFDTPPQKNRTVIPAKVEENLRTPCGDS
jgi:hypothetical protein